ncbi:helix-turn-helix domain-containing protein [Bdellovibrio sp. HCB-110]|uniref:helix-turn-helix domain-containing protein n=1 Tax=Bdellovibrio sp. HCB-110 TaxID=3391182 RepID=UPI0039B54198
MNIDLQEQKFLKKLGARLRDLRHKKGWTLEEAEEHGWSNWRHLQKMEAGKNVTIITLWKVSKLYKISLHDLLNFE